MKVNGLADLAAALKALPAEIAAKNGGPLRVALRASARVVADAAEQRAPKDTGRLGRAIAIQVDRNPGNVTERIVVRPRAGKSRNDPKGAYYWHFLEFGTERQPAQPFIRPAFDAVKEQALTVFRTRLAKGIVRAAKRAAKRGLTRGR
jgi:HK97 gp10 family phage protein